MILIFYRYATLGVSQSITVKRKGESVEVNESELNVGDLFLIKEGMTIPCDSLLVDGKLS